MRFVSPVLPAFIAAATAFLTACGGSGTQGEDPSYLRWGGDLLGGGTNVVVSENVEGDVIVAGRDLSFTGTAGGDYLGAGQTVDVGGRVDGDVRAAARDVRLAGQVGRNVTAAGAVVEVEDAATIDGNAYLAGAQVRVAGDVNGFVRAAGQEIVLEGSVGGSVDVRGGSLRIGPGASIAGDLSYGVPEEDVEIDPAAQISGTVTAAPTGEEPSPAVGIGLFRALWMIGFLVAGLAVVAIFARSASAAAAGLRQRPWAALGFGILWIILVPIGILVIGITGVGLPLALIILVLYLISLYLARAVVAVLLGQLLLRGWNRAPGKGRVAAAFLLGGVILLLLGLIPFVGGIVTLLATIAGLGALVVAYRGRSDYMAEF